MSFSPDALYSWADATSASTQPILLLNHAAYQCQGLPTDPPILFRLPASIFKGFNIKIVGYGRHFKWSIFLSFSGFGKLSKPK